MNLESGIRKHGGESIRPHLESVRDAGSILATSSSRESSFAKAIHPASPVIAVSKLPLLMDCPRMFYLEVNVPRMKARKADHGAGRGRDRERSVLTQETEYHSPPENRTADLQIPSMRLRGRARLLTTAGPKVPLLIRRRAEKGEWREIAIEAAVYCMMFREWGEVCSEALVFETSKGKATRLQISDQEIEQARKLALEASDMASEPKEPEGKTGTWCRLCRFRQGCPALAVKLQPHCLEPRRSRIPVPESSPVCEPAPLYSVEELEGEVPDVPDTLPLYVREQGSKLEIDEGVVVIRKSDAVVARVRLTDVSQICLMGNVQITSQCLRKAFRADIPVSFFTRGGMFCGTARGFSDRNAHYRKAQYEALRGGKPLEIARALVAAKMMNMRSTLRREGHAIEEKTLRTLMKLADDAMKAEDRRSLLGIEGAGASIYFSKFSSLMDSPRNTDRMCFLSRTRRPPRDPVNAMLSFGYSMLAKEVMIALETSGLDSMQGFYHTNRNRRPALALDLMEPLRPPLVDSLVIAMVNKGQVKQTDFVTDKGMVTMNDSMRKAFLQAWEKRLGRSWSFGSPPTVTDCRGMLNKVVLELIAFLLGRKEKFFAPVFR